jgi:hypothetical protein
MNRGGLVPRLHRMHADLARANPAWDDRIEVIYISTHGLATCRTHRADPPIPTAEYLEEVRRSLVGLSNRVPDDAPPGSQAYAILTMCRGLYALRFGERLSKGEAASWAQQEFPRWADLIGRALGWRQRQHDPDGQHGAATVAETRSFVAEMAKLALR